MKKLLFGLIAMLLGSAVSNASTTYDVNRTVGAGTVDGTITTDGHTGVLAASDITAWDLNLSDGTNAFALTNTNSAVFLLIYPSFAATNDLTATPTQLLFDFGATDGGSFLFEVAFGSGQQYYCDNASPSTGLCFAGETISPASETVAAVSDSNLSHVIGTAASRTVPEPSTATVMGLGMLAIVAIQRRRNQIQAGPR